MDYLKLESLISELIVLGKFSKWHVEIHQGRSTTS